MSNPNNFLPVLPESLIERALIADFLLGKGYLLSELQYLAVETAQLLYDEACQFAKRKSNEVFPKISMTMYSAVGFSLN